MTSPPSVLQSADTGGLNLSTIEGMTKFCASNFDGHAVSPKVYQIVAGLGFAPWEIHRAQRVIRHLVTANPAAFTGNVLDVGCGMGDNALFIASRCPCTITAVDFIPRCLEFAKTKAAMRGLHSNIQLVVADVLDLPKSVYSSGPFDMVLDSLTFHVFGDEARSKYLQVLSTVLKPGGTLYLLCLDVSEKHPGGARRYSRQLLQDLFSEKTGWKVVNIADAGIEYHPAFWEGNGRGLFCKMIKL